MDTNTPKRIPFFDASNAPDSTSSEEPLYRPFYTTIYHYTRKEMELTLLEYCVIAFIAGLSKGGEGWFVMYPATLDNMSYNLDIKEEEFMSLVVRLVEQGLLEAGKEGDRIRPTKRWYLAVEEGKKKTEEAFHPKPR